ncbi:hypothetical protein BC828DRAFT_385227 [Blastocladiella britannica]|nr:hypothetical protein BC828DRAFT_385227 [Blastocladiella britannica]
MYKIAFLTVLALLGSGAIAQDASICGDVGRTSIFQTCTANTAAVQASTCGPLVATQGYPYFNCMCTFSQQLVQCYVSSDCSAQEGSRLIAQSQVTSYCNSADLTKPQNPAPLTNSPFDSSSPPTGNGGSVPSSSSSSAAPAATNGGGSSSAKSSTSTATSKATASAQSTGTSGADHNSANHIAAVAGAIAAIAALA